MKSTDGMILYVSREFRCRQSERNGTAFALAVTSRRPGRSPGSRSP